MFGKPSPSWAEVGYGLSWEVLKELLYATPFVNNEFSEFSLRLSLFGSDAMPVEGMVPVLGGIVEDFVVFAAKYQNKYVATI